MIREYIYIDDGELKEGLSHKLCAPISFRRDKKPYRLWSLPHFRCKDIEPPKNLPLIHGDSAFLEDQLRDWSVRQDSLFYRGQFVEGNIWLAIEYEETAVQSE